MKTKKIVIRTERGWAGHFICANQCRFRRNTLLQYNGVEIVVSTIGLMENRLKGKGVGFEKNFSEIGCDRYYETMAFYTDPTDTRYHDADIAKEVHFDSEWSISIIDADDKANEMHEAAVEELTNKLLSKQIV